MNSDLQKELEKMVQILKSGKYSRLQKFLKPTGVLTLECLTRGAIKFNSLRFHRTQDQIAHETQFALNTVGYALDRLRFVGIIVAEPMASIPVAEKERIKPRKPARYYQIKILDEKQLKNMNDLANKEKIPNRKGIRGKVVEGELEETLSSLWEYIKVKQKVTLPQIRAFIGCSRKSSLASRVIDKLEQSGRIKPTSRAEANAHQWIIIQKDKDSVGTNFTNKYTRITQGGSNTLCTNP
jgi:hypothetical protein